MKQSAYPLVSEADNLMQGNLRQFAPYLLIGSSQGSFVLARAWQMLAF